MRPAKEGGHGFLLIFVCLLSYRQPVRQEAKATSPAIATANKTYQYDGGMESQVPRSAGRGRWLFRAFARALPMPHVGTGRGPAV